jgi:hypothetical protein
LFDEKNDFYHTKDLALEHPEICTELVEMLVQDNGGWDGMPSNLKEYKERMGCGIGGYAPVAYSNAISIDLTKL